MPITRSESSTALGGPAATATGSPIRASAGMSIAKNARRILEHERTPNNRFGGDRLVSVYVSDDRTKGAQPLADLAEGFNDFRGGLVRGEFAC